MDILSRLMMEDIIYGYDVLLSALHLTASTLALRAPDVTFRLMHLWSLPLGGPHHRLGSIEFLRESQIPITTDLFGASVTPGQVSATGDLSQQYARIPELDVCVMNPPFTRSVGGNLLFGSVAQAERGQMQKELSKLLHPRGGVVRRGEDPARDLQVLASATAGLGSVFAAIGDRYLKAGGRMALVLPKALLSGVAWQETRLLFGLRYQLEYLVVSHDPARWNFSENTNLSEVLVVARKLDGSHRPAALTGNVVCLNLWKNPATAVEALSIAHAITGGKAPDIESGQGALEVMLGEAKFGEAVSVPWASISGSSWMPPCAFAQSDLLRAAYHLVRGKLYRPGEGIAGEVALCPLGQLGTLGPDRRDIHDGFRLAKGKAKTAYPAFWSHDASSMTTMAQSPNHYLVPLHRAREGRPLRQANVLWPRGGRVLIAERLRLNTQRLASVRLNNRVLSNVWWPLTLHEDEEKNEHALMLWLNSTLGLLILLAHREETEGAWVDFKKPVLSGMPVLDVRALIPLQLQELVNAYDRLSQQPLMPFPQMAQDPTRRAIDEAIAHALGLPDFSILRELLAQEPVVCLQPLA